MTDVRERPRPPVDDGLAAPRAVELVLPAGSPYASVCRLVAAGVAGRHDLTVDRIDELQLAIDAALRQPPASDVVSLRVTPSATELRFELGPLAIDAPSRPAFERVLSTLVKGAVLHDEARETWIDIRIPLATDRG